MCAICDRLIIGVEHIHLLSKQRILENQHRLNVKMYEEFYGGEKMSSILANQYCVEDFPGLLLSPRSYRDGDNFECCSSYYSSLMPSKAKDAGTKPPKHVVWALPLHQSSSLMVYGKLQINFHLHAWVA